MHASRAADTPQEPGGRLLVAGGVAPPARATSREGLYLDQVFPGVPQRIEIIEEKLGNSPGSRHSPAKGKKSPATPGRR